MRIMSEREPTMQQTQIIWQIVTTGRKYRPASDDEGAVCEAMVEAGWLIRVRDRDAVLSYQATREGERAGGKRLVNSRTEPAYVTVGPTAAEGNILWQLAQTGLFYRAPDKDTEAICDRMSEAGWLMRMVDVDDRPFYRLTHAGVKVAHQFSSEMQQAGAALIETTRQKFISDPECVIEGKFLVGVMDELPLWARGYIGWLREKLWEATESK